MEAHTGSAGSGIIERLSHAGRLSQAALCSGVMTPPFAGAGIEQRPSRITAPVAQPQSLSMPSVQTLSAALAGLAGYLDAATLASDGAFCAHVTGQVVIVASRILQRLPIDPLCLIVLPLFAASIVLVTWLYRRWEPQGELAACRVVLMLQSACIAAAWIAARFAPVGKLGRVAVLCLVIALAAQNALHRLNSQLKTCTTAMTGNLAQWLSELLPGGAAPSTRVAGVLLAFTLGCTAGALAVRWFGADALLLPLWAYAGLVRALPLVVRDDVCYKHRAGRAAS